MVAGILFVACLTAAFWIFWRGGSYEVRMEDKRKYEAWLNKWRYK
jgi:hypothetical protein